MNRLKPITKIRIDKHGMLWRDRAGQMKEQRCPYGRNGVRCGDWCPLFQEPYFCHLTETFALQLCRTYMYLAAKDFEDLREREGTDAEESWSGH